MEPLCQEAPMTPLENIKKTIKSELNHSLEEIFDEFHEIPLGSASIAQVHKAKLRETGEFVAIKIQHPMVATYCPSDVAIVKFATKVGELIWPGLKLQWIANEFQKNIMREIDFKNEGLNADKISSLFENDTRVVIPKVFWKYTSKKVLTLSFEEGKSIVDTDYRKKNQIKVSEIANLLAHVFNRQIFEFGFVHSDPHHGNLFIRKEIVNGEISTRLVLLDHGLYRELDKTFRFNYALLWRGVLIQNKDMIRQACSGLNVSNPELFIALVTNRNYQDILNEEFKYDTKSRLGDKRSIFFLI
jgi:aarF domain-containing kinase